MTHVDEPISAIVAAFALFRLVVVVVACTRRDDLRRAHRQASLRLGPNVQFAGRWTVDATYTFTDAHMPEPRLRRHLRTTRDIVNAAIGGQRFAAQTLVAFGVLALILSAIGIFGIVSQVVASRVHEFGVRAALGATPRDLMAIGLPSGLRQTTVGLGVGIVAALVLTRALRTMLSGVTPTDPVTFAAVVVVTGLVALAASLGPPWRAGRIDPNVALRVD